MGNVKAETCCAMIACHLASLNLVSGRRYAIKTLPNYLLPSNPTHGQHF